MKIAKEKLLIEKESGTYGCPNYIDPKNGKAMLMALGVEHDRDGAMLLTEVMENFGLELIKKMKGKVTKELVIETIKKIKV